MHLHSNMFLLFRKHQRPVLIYGKHIYIPICFYYFYSSTRLYYLYDVIYIPICFYYFRVVASLLQYTCFIYIPICFYYFRRGTRGSLANPDLHSNMFLLFPKTHIQRLTKKKYLHSNMFLLFHF